MCLLALLRQRQQRVVAGASSDEICNLVEVAERGVFDGYSRWRWSGRTSSAGRYCSWSRVRWVPESGGGESSERLLCIRCRSSTAERRLRKALPVRLKTPAEKAVSSWWLTSSGYRGTKLVLCCSPQPRFRWFKQFRTNGYVHVGYGG